MKKWSISMYCLIQVSSGTEYRANATRPRFTTYDDMS